MAKPQSVVFLTPQQKRKQQTAPKRNALHSALARAYQPFPSPAMLNDPKNVVGARPIVVNHRGQVADPSGGLGALTARGLKSSAPKPLRVTTAKGKGNPAHGSAGGPATVASPVASTPMSAIPTTREPASMAPRQTPATQTRKLPPKPTAPRVPPSSDVGAAARAGLPSMGSYGQPLDVIRARQIADAETAPLIKQITDAINAKAKAGAGAISGYSTQLSNVLQALAQTAGDPYRQAEQGQAASDSALMQAVTGAGTDQAQQLASKLQAIGAPGAAIDATAGQVGTDAHGAGAALYGKGSASLSELLGREATARDYAGKQLGIAGLTGLQASRDLQASSAKDLADQVGQVKAKVPDIIQSALSGLYGARSDARKQAYTEMVANKEFGLKQQTANTQAAAAAAKQDMEWNRYLSSMYGVDANGNPTLAGSREARAVAKAAKTNAAKAKGMTAGQYAGLTAKAQRDAQIMHEGEQRSDGSWKTYPVADYQTALSRLMAAHKGLRLSDAQAILNTYWTEPGQEGRPALSFQQRQALAQAGVPANMIAAAMWDPAKASALLNAASRSAA